MTSRLVDFHCHLDLYRDHADLVRECERQQIFTLAVTTTPRAWPRNHELAATTKYVRAALGLHPQLIREYAHELAIWREFLPATRYVGEVGLDAGPKHYTSFITQKDVFGAILRECAARGDKILTIHSVRAVGIVLDMLEELLPVSRGTSVLHWFTGSKSEAARAVQLGAYFSINPAMLEGDRHRAMVASLPKERLLTETDGPFGKVDGRDARPADVATTIDKLARLLSISAPELTDIVADNLKRLVTS
jgi:TatD DNase family protein